MALHLQLVSRLAQSADHLQVRPDSALDYCPSQKRTHSITIICRFSDVVTLDHELKMAFLTNRLLRAFELGQGERDED